MRYQKQNTFVTHNGTNCFVKIKVGDFFSSSGAFKISAKLFLVFYEKKFLSQNFTHILHMDFDREIHFYYLEFVKQIVVNKLIVKNFFKWIF